MFYALQLDQLKTPSSQITPLAISAAEAPRNSAIEHLQLLSSLIQLTSSQVQSEEEFFDEFSKAENSGLAVIYKVMQILQTFIFGVKPKYFSGNIQQSVKAFCQSNLQGLVQQVVTTGCMVCEKVYQICKRVVQKAESIFEKYQVQKFLMQPPPNLKDEEFLKYQQVLMNLIKIINDLVRIVQLIVGESGAKIAQIELESEPEFLSLAQVHKTLKAFA